MAQVEIQAETSMDATDVTASPLDISGNAYDDDIVVEVRVRAIATTTDYCLLIEVVEAADFTTPIPVAVAWGKAPVVGGADHVHKFHKRSLFPLGWGNTNGKVRIHLVQGTDALVRAVVV